MNARTPAGQQPRKRKTKPAGADAQRDGNGSSAQKKTPEGPRTEQAKKKRFKRPAEFSAGAAAAIGLLVSLFGLEGSQAKELTASLVGVVGVVPYAVSKLTDWKRGKDEREAEQLDFMEERIIIEKEHNAFEERAAIALESIAGRGALTQGNNDTATDVVDDSDGEAEGE